MSETISGRYGQIAVELQEILGATITLAEGPVAFRIDETIDVVIELNDTTDRITLSATSSLEWPPLSPHDVRTLLNASTASMQTLGVAIGLHPLSERSVAVWSGPLVALRPGEIRERLQSVLVAASQVAAHFQQNALVAEKSPGEIFTSPEAVFIRG